MLRHIGLTQQANLIEAAVFKTIQQHKAVLSVDLQSFSIYHAPPSLSPSLPLPLPPSLPPSLHLSLSLAACCMQVITGDLGGSAKCSEYTQEIIRNMNCP